MPKGIFKRHPHSAGTRRKISEAMKGKPPTMGMLGKHHTELSKVKSRESNVGKKRSQKTKKNISNSLLREKNPNWLGGISFGLYGLEFNDDLKEVIRNRDRRKCQVCGKQELESGEKLIVHHIDYNKRNNDPRNLIGLCRSCHGKTNHNRNYWINYFLSS